METFIQPSFAKGEIGPALYGRVDTAAYQVGLRTARNLIVHTYGGASNRPGTIMIGPCLDHTASRIRLIEFQFKTTDSYILEFGNFYFRVIRNDAHVLEAAKTITAVTNANPGVFTSTGHGYVDNQEVLIDGIVGMSNLNGRRFIVDAIDANTFSLKDQITFAPVDTSLLGTYVSGGTAARVYTVATPYALADLPLLKYVQSADVMTLTHPSYPVYQLSRTGHAAWTIVPDQFGPSISYPTSLAITPNTTGTTTYSYKVTAIAADNGEESLVAASSTSKTITAITKANPAVVTSASHGFTGGEEILITGVVGMVQINETRALITSVTTNTFALSGVDSTNYTAYSSGGAARMTRNFTTTGNAAANNTIAWTGVAGAASYNVYKFNTDSYGFIANTVGTSFTDTNIAADLTAGPPQFKNPFSSPGNYPGVASYYEQRRVFGGSFNNPDTSDYSQVGNFDNFNVSNPIQSDDSISATLASRQVNEIRAYIPMNDLLVFTSGSEWKINSGPDSSFGPDTIKQKPQSGWGSSHLRPIVVGSNVIYVLESKSFVRSFGYSFQLDAYTGSDLGLLAPHLLENNTVEDWCYSVNPESRIYAVRDDGQILTITYDNDQQVLAWTHWDTQGKFEAIASVRNPDGTPGPDGIYFVVKRFVNGKTVRYIEKLADRRFTDVRDCYFVDFGLTFDNPVPITGVGLFSPVVITAPAHGFANGDMIDISDITWQQSTDAMGNVTSPNNLNGVRYTIQNVQTDTFELVNTSSSGFVPYVEGGYARKAVLQLSGLQHLANTAVACLSDGNVTGGITVDGNGNVTLPRRASRVHIGLPYIADLETLNVEAPQSTIQGKPKKITTVVVRFKQSRGLFIGQNTEKLIEMKQREFEPMGDPTALLTGDKKIGLLPHWNSDGRLFLRQLYPLPMTILAIIPDLEIGMD